MTRQSKTPARDRDLREDPAGWFCAAAILVLGAAFIVALVMAIATGECTVACDNWQWE